MGNPLQLNLPPACIKSSLSWVIEGHGNDVSQKLKYNELVQGLSNFDRPLFCEHNKVVIIYIFGRICTILSFSFMCLSSYCFFLFWMCNLLIASRPRHLSPTGSDRKGTAFPLSLWSLRLCVPKVQAEHAGLNLDHCVPTWKRVQHP